LRPKFAIFDSSVWIEILGSGPLAKFCQKELHLHGKVIVPSLVLYEVYRKVATQISEDQGLSVVAMLSQYQVVDLTREVALLAADLSIQNRLGMADSMVLAHAQSIGAVLVTLDNDFVGVDGVKVIRKSV